MVAYSACAICYLTFWKLGLKNELAGGKIFWGEKHVPRLVDGFDGQTIIPHGRLSSGWVSRKIWIPDYSRDIFGLWSNTLDTIWRTLKNIKQNRETKTEIHNPILWIQLNWHIFRQVCHEIIITWICTVQESTNNWSHELYKIPPSHCFFDSSKISRFVVKI